MKIDIELSEEMLETIMGKTLEEDFYRCLESYKELKDKRILKNYEKIDLVDTEGHLLALAQVHDYYVFESDLLQQYEEAKE